MTAGKRRRSKHLAAAAAKRPKAAAALEAEELPPQMPLSLAAPTTFELYYQAQVRASLPFREAAFSVHAAHSSKTLLAERQVHHRLRYDNRRTPRHLTWGRQVQEPGQGRHGSITHFGVCGWSLDKDARRDNWEAR